jgi:hypothetical protein
MGVCLRANEARCRDKADYQQTLHILVPPSLPRASLALARDRTRVSHKNRSRLAPDLDLKTL